MNKRQRKKKAKKIMDHIFNVLQSSFTQSEKLPIKEIDLKDFKIKIDQEKGSITSSYKIPTPIYSSTYIFEFKREDFNK